MVKWGFYVATLACYLRIVIDMIQQSMLGKWLSLNGLTWVAKGTLSMIHYNHGLEDHVEFFITKVKHFFELQVMRGVKKAWLDVIA